MEWAFPAQSGRAPRCIALFYLATLKPAACCSIREQTSTQKTRGIPAAHCCRIGAAGCACAYVNCFIFVRGTTPLHASASCGHFEICRLLLEWKADVTARDGSLWLGLGFTVGLCTPLHCSAQFGHFEICRLLLDSKADVAAKNDQYVGRLFRSRILHH
jgi:hypothetical protein